MTEYRVFIEKAGRNYSAYSPDLPGCIATGKTPEETARNMREAIELHLEGMADDEAYDKWFVEECERRMDEPHLTREQVEGEFGL